MDLPTRKVTARVLGAIGEILLLEPRPDLAAIDVHSA
jgi:hypothetical protein